MKTEKNIKYQIWFSKQGEAKYLSQLDIAMLLQQAIRRADLPVKFEGQFNPRMKISFRTSVPVGVSSLGEPFELMLKEAINKTKMLKMLRENLPSGLGIAKIEDFKKIEKHFFTIYHKIEIAYQISSQIIDNIINSKEIWITRKRKKKIKKFNCRPFIQKCTLDNSVNDSSIVYITILTTPKGSISIWEIIDLLKIERNENSLLGITRTSVKFESA